MWLTKRRRNKWEIWTSRLSNHLWTLELTKALENKAPQTKLPSSSHHSSKTKAKVNSSKRSKSAYFRQVQTIHTCLIDPIEQATIQIYLIKFILLTLCTHTIILQMQIPNLSHVLLRDFIIHYKEQKLILSYQMVFLNRIIHKHLNPQTKVIIHNMELTTRYWITTRVHKITSKLSKTRISCRGRLWREDQRQTRGAKVWCVAWVATLSPTRLAQFNVLRPCRTQRWTGIFQELRR